MSVEANKALVRRTYEEGVNHADLTLLDALFAPNYVNHNSSLPCDLEGLEAFKNYLQIARLDVFSDLRTTIEDIFGEGDKVMVRHTWHGIHKATGRAVRFTGIDVYRIEHGKIAEEWVESNTLSILQQLGVETPWHLLIGTK
jgi:predicted ester cyclase